MQSMILQFGIVAVFLLSLLVAKLITSKHPAKRDQVAAIGTALAALCLGAIALGKRSGSSAALAVLFICFSVTLWHRQQRRESSEPTAPADR